LRFFVTCTVAFSLFLIIISCKPEDGFCLEETYRGDENFLCNEMDKYFKTSGEEVNSYYTEKVLVYGNTVLRADETETRKPDYIPEAIPIERMSECTFAPAKSGMVCNKWASFNFDSIDNISVEFSSRNNYNFSEEIALEYIKIYLDAKTISGSVKGTEITLGDTLEIDGSSVGVIHRYSMLPK
jgi:hypothetical protein